MGKKKAGLLYPNLYTHTQWTSTKCKIFIELLINLLVYSKPPTFDKGLSFFGWDSEEKRKNNNNCVQKLFFSIPTIHKYDLLFRGNIIDEMVQELREKPIAINQDEANQQHYEVHLYKTSSTIHLFRF